MKAVLWTGVWLVLAAAAQGALSARLAVGWAQPDFILVAAVVLAMHRSADGAAFTGFFAGVFHSAILNGHMMALTVSRTLTCLVANRFFEASLGRNAITASAIVAVSTLIASLLYLFLAIPENIVRWLTDTIGGALYNGLLAIPCYWLYNKLSPSVASR